MFFMGSERLPLVERVKASRGQPFHLRYQTQKKGKGMSREMEELKMGQNGGMKEIARSPAPSGNSFATHSLANNR